MDGRIITTKNSSDIIGKRTCDLPACNAVPQPNAPPRVTADCYNKFIITDRHYLYTVKKNVSVGCVGRGAGTTYISVQIKQNEPEYQTH